ncbi:MAG: hypothetical protein KatS3mg105_0047 [Gemmatales bacterium]|nr:MAG: hypothetical protein KatS3mg105_0047 [Gemmatales bacterium]
MAITIAHVSDVHITAHPLGWRLRDWFNKRFPGWLNFQFLGRRWRFRRANEVLAALSADLKSRPLQHVVFSGDATAMGFEAEFAAAAKLLDLKHQDMPPGLAVPGNHDYYTQHSAAEGHFERYFAHWQTGVRVDNETYPFAQRVGNIWLIGVNSAVGNRWAWEACGLVDEAQLGRLARLLDRLEPGPRVLVTHFPVALANGNPERSTHGLRNLHEVVEVAAGGGVQLWLHGHRHRPYRLLQGTAAPFPVICAGTATQTNLWSYFEYTFDDGHAVALQRTFNPQTCRFEDRETFQFAFPYSRPLPEAKQELQSSDNQV